MNAVPEISPPPVGDTRRSIEFLKAWAPNGPWVVASDNSSEPGKDFPTATFGPGEEKVLYQWIEKRQGIWNLYFGINPPRARVSKKPNKLDIKALVTLHVDADPDKCKELHQERARILAAIKTYPVRPSVVLDSGGGYWAFWLLKQAHAIPAPTDAARRAWASQRKEQPIPSEELKCLNTYFAEVTKLEAVNMKLATDLAGGDHCHNINRVARLPFTVNVPRQKTKLGRVPAVSTVVWAEWERRYDLTDFEAVGVEAPVAIGWNALPAVDIDELPVSERIKNLIRGIDDPEHSYKSRSERTFATIVAMLAGGCDDETIAAVLLDDRLAIAGHVLEQKSAREYLAKQIKNARAKMAAGADGKVAEINATYALVLVGDKAAVMKQGMTPEGHEELCFLSLSAFKSWHGNQFIKVGKKTRPLAEYWLAHRDRRQYEGIVFAPGREHRGYYNLWRGFAVEPRPGDWSKFRAHLADNVCRGDPALLAWVIGWFAAITQHPEKKSGTSLVIRGKEGTGKTKVGEVFGSLFGSHYVAVSDPRYITGRFNAHLSSCLLLHAEEAFWAGDHAAEGKLKDLITGEAHLIEYKGKEPIRVRNFIRLFVTGNPDWVVPVSLEGRRFAVLEIGEAHMKDSAYFAAIDEEMGNGGREALLHSLMGFDLSTVNLRDVPKTAALLDQKLASLTPEQGWWLDVLQNGRLPYGTGCAYAAPASLLFDDYMQHANKVGVRRRSIETQIGNFLRKVAPGLTRRITIYRTYNKDEEGSVYEFPHLTICREHFAKLLEHPVEWHGPEEWLDEPVQHGGGYGDGEPM